MENLSSEKPVLLTWDTPWDPIADAFSVIDLDTEQEIPQRDLAWRIASIPPDTAFLTT